MTIHDCALNGASLSWLDERICVLDVQEDAPRLRLPAFPLPLGGQFLSPVRESLSVRVTFAIHEEDPARRWSLLERVRAWAADGGLLTLDARPDQQLTVVCTANLMRCVISISLSGLLPLTFRLARLRYITKTSS